MAPPTSVGTQITELSTLLSRLVPKSGGPCVIHSSVPPNSTPSRTRRAPDPSPALPLAPVSRTAWRPWSLGPGGLRASPRAPPGPPGWAFPGGVPGGEWDRPGPSLAASSGGSELRSQGQLNREPRSYKEFPKPVY